MAINKVVGLYRFKDLKDKIIYIGKSSNIYERLNSHFSKNGGGLDLECYRKTVQVEYCNIGNDLSTEIYETYYINKYKPKYNTAKIYNSPIDIFLPELIWQPIHNQITDIDDINRKLVESQNSLNLIQHKQIAIQCLYEDKVKILNKTIKGIKQTEKIENNQHNKLNSIDSNNCKMKSFNLETVIELYKKYRLDNITFSSKIIDGNTNILNCNIVVSLHNNYIYIKDVLRDEKYENEYGEFLYDVNSEKSFHYLINQEIITSSVLGFIPSNTIAYILHRQDLEEELINLQKSTYLDENYKCSDEFNFKNRFEEHKASRIENLHKKINEINQAIEITSKDKAS